MSTFSASNMFTILIGKNINRTGSVQYTDPNAANYLADGEIIVTGQDGSVVSAPTFGTHQRLRVVQRSGSTLRYSPWIQGNGVIAYKGSTGTAATEQTYTLGYTGSTGTIDVTGTDPFTLKIEYTFDNEMWSEQALFVVTSPYDVTTPTELETAMHFAEQINVNANHPMHSMGADNPLVRAFVFSDENGAAITTAGTATAWVAVQDSPVVKANGTLGAINFAVGDYIRFGIVGSGATADTDAVYEIESIDTTLATMTLTMPFQGTSGSRAEANEIVFIANATAIAGAGGLSIVAQEAKWVLDHFKYLQVTFRVGKTGWGSTTVTQVAPVRPKGHSKQIAELESFGKGFDGALNRTTIPLPTVQVDTIASTLYDVMTIAFYDDSNYGPIAGPARMRQEVIIAVVDDNATPVANQMNEIADAFDAWMPTVPAALPAQLTSFAG